MAISTIKYRSQLEQYHGVTETIQALIDNGANPGEIAVISRKHKTLEGLLPLLNAKTIPFYYEKNNNVLENYHILQIITISRFVYSLCSEDQGRMDSLLPEILAYPFWELSSVTLWELAIAANKKRCSWLEIMQMNEDEANEDNVSTISSHSDKQKLAHIAKFLIFLGQSAKSETAEMILDRIVGSGNQVFLEEDFDDYDEIVIEELKEFVSPFKTYYFDTALQQSLKPKSLDQQEASKHGSDSYIGLLSSLRVLISAVRSHRRREVFKLKDFIDFVDLAQLNSIPITDKQVFNTKNDAINLLSAHKSKGLEFEHVFIINAVKSEWEAPGRGNRVSFPSNLPLEPDKDTLDDKVRLFFVAITRARKNLYLTSYAFDEAGKETNEVSFLTIQWQQQSYQEHIQQKLLETYTFKTDSIVILTNSHKKLLYNLIENYKLSATNLINYLDITKGGPLNFLETNLLRFPQSKNKHASYGSAVHNAIRALYVEYARTNKLPQLAYLLEQFEVCLQTEGLSEKDFSDCMKNGLKKLELYYQQRSEYFDIKSIIERDFKNYNVRIGDALITGKLDKIDIDEENKEIVVTDFKTGSHLKSWKNSDEYKKQKAWKYETQLLFYKLLIERSNEFGGRYNVKRCCLEFVSDPKYDPIVLLDKLIKENETDVLERLIQVVYNKICNLEFPDTSNYSQNIKGVESFINDLVDGNI